jgi:predicted aspartyl protease
MKAVTPRGRADVLEEATDPMGKVTCSFVARNWADVELIALGKRKQAAREMKGEALVDTGPTKLYLKPSLIRALGLRQIGEGTSLTMSNRKEKRRVFSPIELEIQGRTGRFDVLELAEELPNVIGQIPLEDLDWVVDPKNRKLIPNPEHKDGVMFDDF